MRTLTKILLPCCLLLALAAAAAAAPPAIDAASAQAFMNGANATLGTPDGVPPSGETICNGLVGAAHGLCTAYCEAMDCDSGAPQASQKACDKVRANFTTITGQGLPCDCPCVTQVPGFIEALNSLNSNVQGCFEAPTPDSNLVVVFTDIFSFNPAGGFFPGGGVCGSFPTIPFPITEAQGMACFNLIVQKAAAAGIQCTPPV